VTQYVDSSALAKRYLDESDALGARELLSADPAWVTANHAYTEVYRALHLRGAAGERGRALAKLDEDWARMNVVAVDDALCRRAGEIAVGVNTRTLDALHLAAAERAGGRSLPFLTYDLRQAIAARALGFTVLGS
jgi:predicted nucleic acid-binding protein